MSELAGQIWMVGFPLWNGLGWVVLFREILWLRYDYPLFILVICLNKLGGWILVIDLLFF